jgi:hypothetical protein
VRLIAEAPHSLLLLRQASLLAGPLHPRQLIHALAEVEAHAPTSRLV